MVSSEPKPQRSEMRFTGRRNSDNSRRAASTLSRSMARAGVTPVAPNSTEDDAVQSASRSLTQISGF